MRSPAAFLLLLTVLIVPATAAAEPLTFQPSTSTRENLDHHYIYTWRIDGVTEVGDPMVLSSRDNTTNRLLTRLLDDAMKRTGELSPVASAESGAYAYHFGEAQIASLTDYILNGNDFALALDPGSHFDTDDVKAFIEQSAAPQVVPEPVSMLLLGTGLAGLVRLRSRLRRDRSAFA